MDKYQAWSGAVSISEKLLKEQAIEIVWAPYLEKSNKLVFTETRTTKSLIGGFDLYRRRNIWCVGAVPRGRFFDPYIICSFLSQFSNLRTLHDILTTKGYEQFVKGLMEMNPFQHC